MEWIDVKSVKPKFEEGVLVWCPLWGIYLAIYSQISDSNYGEWRDWNNISVIPPKTWMPLPQPPKQKNNLIQ